MPPIPEARITANTTMFILDLLAIGQKRTLAGWTVQSKGLVCRERPLWVGSGHCTWTTRPDMVAIRARDCDKRRTSDRVRPCPTYAAFEVSPPASSIPPTYR